MRCRNNLKEIALGCHNYHSAVGTTALITWTDGRTLISGNNQQDVDFVVRLHAFVSAYGPLPKKKVSGTLRRSKLPHLLRLQSSRHLFLGQALLFRPPVEPLVAVDLPGHGHSDWRADHDYTPASNAEDVAVALRELAPASRLVVGMSLGGLTGNDRPWRSRWVVGKWSPPPGSVSPMFHLGHMQSFQQLTLRKTRPHFANARSIRNALDRARLRQARRLFERRATPLTRDALMTIEADEIRSSRVFVKD